MADQVQQGHLYSQPSKLEEIEQHLKACSRLSSPRIVIVCDSIARGLTRKDNFNDVNTLNFGIGRDRTDNILRTVQYYIFPNPASSPTF